MEIKKDNWIKFRKIFDCINADSDDSLASILELIPALDKFLSMAPSVVFIIDYNTMQYLYFNESIHDYVGSIAENYLKKGVQFAIDNYHPDDMEILIAQIYPHIKNFLKTVPPETYKEYKFSFNCRYKREDGTYQHFVQHSTYLPDEAGNVRYNFGMGSNLPNTDKIKITLTIEKREKGNYKQVSIEEINGIIPNIFTKREIQVLSLICHGLSSTAIADKLFLSEHTVNNHRKKMLQKTGLANTPSLINYALENKLI